MLQKEGGRPGIANRCLSACGRENAIHLVIAPYVFVLFFGGGGMFCDPKVDFVFARADSDLPNVYLYMMGVCGSKQIRCCDVHELRALGANYCTVVVTCCPQVCIMIHSGSRGLGHQVATDALVQMEAAMARDKIDTNDRQLACAKINSQVHTVVLLLILCTQLKSCCGRRHQGTSCADVWTTFAPLRC